MAEFGFVYVLGNDKMPGVYKVGCTERSPRERCAELSRPTGVPVPFDVLFYIEVRDFQAVEKRMHSYLAAHRISAEREFFECGLEWIASLFYYFPERLSFCDATEKFEGSESPAKQNFYSWSDLISQLPSVELRLSELRNPFDKRPTELEMDEAVDEYREMYEMSPEPLRLVAGSHAQ